jgi:L-aminopeptidase/D-esterase-like protein
VTPSPALDGFGLAIGHATDESGGTGCTVVRGTEAPLRASAFVLGRATGTRELALLAPEAMVDRVAAILLSGGSAYGLDAAAGVMRWMEEHERGFPIGGGVVPIVPAAVVFDLAPLGRFDARPTAEMAYAACASATSSHVAEGSVGAGTGCTVGKALGFTRAMKGGVGIAVTGPEREGGVAAAAVAVVNAFGHVRAADGSILAGARLPDGGYADTERLLMHANPAELAAANTTLAVVALNVALSKVELFQVARAASAALHRRLGPAGTSFDGDVVFAVSPMTGAHAPLPQAEAFATAALERAIERAVRMARGRDGVPGLADTAR